MTVKDLTPTMNQEVFDTLVRTHARVTVAFNLHRHEYSIRVGGKVMCYTEEVTLYGVTFRVNEKGRQRVIQTGQKNLHAFVEGHLTTTDTKKLSDPGVPVRYNPFESPDFRTLDGEPVERCTYMRLYLEDGKYRTLGYNPQTGRRS